MDEMVNMVLHCPVCGTQHIDEPHGEWTNPPHRSHLCATCGTVWRPADVPTNGVRAVETCGAADTWPRKAAPPATFCTEHYMNAAWLCVVNAQGYSRGVARFLRPESVRIFNETLALAKMAAHAHGASGI